MYVCLCKNITCSDIREAAAREGLCSLRDLKDRLGVASQCGKCARCARGVLEETLRETGRARGAASGALAAA